MKPFGGFDHNAQSLRVVTLLEARYADFDGLNLTWETLEGLAKHNGPLRRPPPYVAALRRAAITLELAHLCRRPRRRWRRWPTTSPTTATTSTTAGGPASSPPPTWSTCRWWARRWPRRRRASLDVPPSRLRHETIRRVIDRLVTDLVAESRRRMAALAPADADAIRHARRPVVGFSEPMAEANRAIREFLFARMYRHWRVNRMTAKARRVVARRVRPAARRDRAAAGRLARPRRRARHRRAAAVVCDYIAGMTDRYAREEHLRLTDLRSRADRFVNGNCYGAEHFCVDARPRRRGASCRGSGAARRGGGAGGGGAARARRGMATWPPTPRWWRPRRRAASRRRSPPRWSPRWRATRWWPRPRAAGPGFVNLRLHPDAWRGLLPVILAAGEGYGDSAAGAGVRINVEYVSANPTGPLHIGHCRGAVVGDALANLLAKVGYSVTKEFYINDAGNQVAALAWAAYWRYLQALGTPLTEEEYSAQVPGGLQYRGDYLVPVGQALAAKFGASLAVPETQVAPPETWFATVRDFALAMMMEAMKADLAALGVRQEVFASERGAGRIRRRRRRHRAHAAARPDLRGHAGAAQGQDAGRLGAARADRCSAPRRSATTWTGRCGNPTAANTYFANDIAYHADKIARGFEQMIDVWGADHGGYVKRMQAAAKAFGGTLDIVLCQIVPC